MKKILKSIMMLAAVLTAGTAMTSCNSESEQIPEAQQPEKGKVKMIVHASKANDATRAVYFDGEDTSVLLAKWEEGDVVEVLDADTRDVLGTLEAESEGIETTLSGELDHRASNGQYYLFVKSAQKDYTGQNGTFENLSNYDYAEVVVYDPSESGDIILNDIVFSNTQSMIKFVLNDEGGNPIYPTHFSISLKTVNPSFPEAIILTIDWTQTTVPVTYGPLEFDIANDPEDPTTSEVWVALYSMESGNVEITVTDINGDVYNLSKSDVSFSSKYYRIALYMQKETPGVHSRQSYGTATDYKWFNE